MTDLPENMLLSDNPDIKLIGESVDLIIGVPGLTCEIGLRAGGGSHYIMDGLRKTNQEKTHIAIDPFGNILYEAHDNVYGRLGYNNVMRNECLSSLYKISTDLRIDFLFFQLEDTEFFKRYYDGIPVYKNDEKTIENTYSLVYFDGPHALKSVLAEFLFFNERASKGAVFLFDDTGHYDHATLEKDYLFKMGWELISKTTTKANYRKVGV